MLDNRGAGISAVTQAKLNLTTEPTIEIVKGWFVASTVLFVIQFPFGREPESFTGNTGRIGLRYVNPAAVSTANYHAAISSSRSKSCVA